MAENSVLRILVIQAGLLETGPKAEQWTWTDSDIGDLRTQRG